MCHVSVTHPSSSTPASLPISIVTAGSLEVVPDVSRFGHAPLLLPPRLYPCDTLTRMRCLVLLALSAASLPAQLPAPNDSGVSLGHIHLMVADPDAQKKIWVDVLGAQVTHAGTLELLKLPGIFIIVGKARTPPAEGTEGSMVNHFGFLVRSYAETKAKLTAAGLDFAMDNAAGRQLIANFPDRVKVE